MSLCLEFARSLPDSKTLKFQIKLFLIYNALTRLLVLARVGRLNSRASRLLANFNQSWFESTFGGQSGIKPFPYRVETLKDLIIFLFWVYTAISQPMFNLSRETPSGVEANGAGVSGSASSAANVSPIKKSFGNFSMLNLNDLVLYFDNFGQDLRETLIPELVFRLDKLFANAPTTQLLSGIRDLSTQPSFLLTYCVFLLEKEEYLKAEALMKELVMFKIEQTTKFN